MNSETNVVVADDWDSQWAVTAISDIRADVAVCSEVLEHLNDPATFLRTATAALSPGATFIVTVPGGPRSEFDRLIGHRRHYTPQSIRQLFEVLFRFNLRRSRWGWQNVAIARWPAGHGQTPHGG